MTTITHRIRFSVCLIGTFVVSLVAGFGSVTADERDDRSRAQSLFLEGRKAIDAGNWKDGCPKVRRSMELFAVANSHFTIAQCSEHDGRIAPALEHWKRGLALVDQNDARAKVANERIALLEPRVPHIRVVVPSPSITRVIHLDGVELSAEALSAPLRVDPGKHVFVVQAEGYQELRHEVDIGETERLEFIAKVGPTREGTSSHPRRVAGFVLGGVGVAGLLASAGTAYGVHSVDGDIETCLIQECTVADRAEKVDRYKSLLVANTVSLGVGLAGVGAGLILVLTAPKTSGDKPADTAVVPLFVPGGAGIGLSGRF